MFKYGISNIFFLPRDGWEPKIPKDCSIFMPRNGTASVLLFCRIVRNKILKVCLYFCSTKRNSECFPLTRNGLEWNSESILFQDTAGIPLEQTLCSVFRGKKILPENGKPSPRPIHTGKKTGLKISSHSPFHLLGYIVLPVHCPR